MKKLKSIFLLMALIAVTASCEDDGGESSLSFREGGVPDIQKAEGSDAFINLLSIQEGGTATLSFTVDKGFGDIASMDVVGFYFTAEGGVERAVLAEDVTTFPSTITVTSQQLIDLFPGLNSADDFGLGDQLLVSADVTLENGDMYSLISPEGNANYGADISNSTVFSVIQVYNVSCPSDLAGTYDFTTTNVGEPGGFLVEGPLTGSVTLTDAGGGIYDISDGSYGGWEGLYGPGNIASGVTLIDICGQLSFGGADDFGDTYTISDVAVNGSDLSFHWENTYGEFGDTVLTRTDGTEWPPLTSD